MFGIPGRSIRYAKAITLTIAALLLGVSCGEQRATAPESASSRTETSKPSLLECPTNETLTTTTLVGLLGGTVQLGATSITIPSGALTAPTLIQITIPASPYMEIDVSAVGSASFVFQQPVTVTLDYSRCSRSNIDQQTLEVWHIDTTTHELLENMGGVDDKSARSITFTTGHLSGYAVAN